MKKEKQNSSFRRAPKNYFKIGWFLIITLILIAWIICLWYYTMIARYSTLCLDKVEEEVWSKLMDVDSKYLWRTNRAYYYYWYFRSYDRKYMYNCSVIDKDNIDVELENLWYIPTPNADS